MKIQEYGIKKKKLKMKIRSQKKFLLKKKVISTEFNPLLKLDLSKNEQNNKNF